MVIIDYKWPAVQVLLTITVKILTTQRWGKTTCFVCQDTLTSKAFLSPYTMCIQTHTHSHTHRAYIWWHTTVIITLCIDFCSSGWIHHSTQGLSIPGARAALTWADPAKRILGSYKKSRKGTHARQGTHFKSNKTRSVCLGSKEPEYWVHADCITDVFDREQQSI